MEIQSRNMISFTLLKLLLCSGVEINAGYRVSRPLELLTVWQIKPRLHHSAETAQSIFGLNSLKPYESHDIHSLRLPP